MNESKNHLFIAYAAQPPLRAEAMRRTTEELNARGTKAVGWESLGVAGRRLIDPILEEISKSSSIVADLSSMNDNVLFEFGFALARGKDTYIAFDESDTTSRELWTTFPIFQQIGRIDYGGNHQRLANGILDAVSRASTALSESLIAGAQPREPNAVFTVHSPVKHIAAEALERYLERQTHLKFRGSSNDLIIAPLDFYTKQIYQSSAAIFHLLGTNRHGAREHNALASFLAGFARGLDLPIIMAVEKGYRTPLDYVDLVFEYSNSNELQTKIQAWLESLPKDTATQRRLGRLALDIELPIQSFGQYVAEYELGSLPKYFVQTSEFSKIVAGEARVFAGRKGTGKSATMSQVAAELHLDTGVLVVPIKPSSHEMSGLTDFVDRFSDEEHLEYLLTMVWTFIIETEVALKAAQTARLKVGAPSADQSLEDLEALLDYMSIDIKSSFPDRIEGVLERLSSKLSSPSSKLTAEVVARALRTDGLNRLNKLTADVLKGQSRVAVLVDNLDKNWEQGRQIDILSRLILALLVASGKIERDYSSVRARDHELVCTIALFIRTDILDAVKKYAREPDKIGTHAVDWDDDQLLVRVLEERYGANSLKNSSTMWAELFCEETSGLPTRDFFLWRVLRRPRDFIYMANAALTTAINRKHSRIEASDILYAEKDYSRFALEALLVESESARIELEEVLYEFAGASATLTALELDELLGSRGDTPTLIEWLMSASFLGVETAIDHFDYVQGAESSRRKMKVAERSSQKNNRDLRFRVHPAFRCSLEIIDDDLHSTN